MDNIERKIHICKKRCYYSRTVEKKEKIKGKW